jgi:hypothetical protein
MLRVLPPGPLFAIPLSALLQKGQLMNRFTFATLALSTALLAGCENGGMFGSHDNKSDVSVKQRHDVTASDLPAAVDRSFKSDHPGATIDNIVEKRYSNGATGYRITYTASDGKRQTAEYNAQGRMAQ